MASIPEWFFVMSLGLFGLLFGSLANVVIWRVPRGESIVAPGSHCPSCGHAIRWYDNIPVLSWLILGARCRDCGSRIPIRYPAVELLSGVLWLIAALLWGMSIRTIFGVALFYMLMILTFIDLDHLRLPNPVVASLAGVGILGVALAKLAQVDAVPILLGRGLMSDPLLYAAAGIAFGGGTSALMAGVYALVRRSAGLGMGDIKLLSVLGLFFGPYVLMVLFVGSILGAVVGVIMTIGRRESGEAARVPFGPFLAAGGVVVAAWGPAIWTWYLQLARIA